MRGQHGVVITTRMPQKYYNGIFQILMQKNGSIIFVVLSNRLQVKAVLNKGVNQMTIKSRANTKYNRVDLTIESDSAKITISVDSYHEAENLIAELKDVMSEIVRIWPELEELTK